MGPSENAERDAQYLTRAKADGLRRIRDSGPYAWCAGHGRGGGAIMRMFDRMARDGLCTKPPYNITEHGRAVLTRYEEAHGKGH